MIEVVDMIVDAADLLSAERPSRLRMEEAKSDHTSLLEFVREQHPVFVQFYEQPKPATSIHTFHQDRELVGAVLLEHKPAAAESQRDAALGCLVIDERVRGRGLGSEAIRLSAEALLQEGFERVIAEWVASVPLYERLGFREWKRRWVDPAT